MRSKVIVNDHLWYDLIVTSFDHNLTNYLHIFTVLPYVSCILNPLREDSPYVARNASCIEMVVIFEPVLWSPGTIPSVRLPTFVHVLVARLFVCFITMVVGHIDYSRSHVVSPGWSGICRPRHCALITEIKPLKTVCAPVSTDSI